MSPGLASSVLVLPRDRLSKSIRELRAKQAPGIPQFRDEPGFQPKRTLLAYEVRLTLADWKRRNSRTLASLLPLHVSHVFRVEAAWFLLQVPSNIC